MKHALALRVMFPVSPRGGQRLLVALCTLLICSCKAPGPSQPSPGMVSNASPALPPQAFTGNLPAPPGPGVIPAGYSQGMPAGVPLPATVSGPWAPPGMPQPWPYAA